MSTATELMRRALESFDWMDVDNSVTDDIRSHLASEPEAEPLLWLCSQIEIQDGEEHEDFELEWDKDNVPYWVRRGWKVEPLYTRPSPARKPMTEEEINRELPFECSGIYFDGFRDGIDFAEKHHGIGGGDE